MNLDHISTDHVELNGPKGQFMIYKPTHPGKSVRKVIGSHLSKEMGLKDKMGGNI